MIEDAAQKAGIDLTFERAAAQMIAFDTRADKRFTDSEALEARWERELRLAGWSREAFVFVLEKGARDAERENVGETPDARAQRLNNRVMVALGELQKSTAVFSRARLYQEAFESLQCEVTTGEEAAMIVEGLEASGQLVKLANVKSEPVYTTAEMIAQEKAILNTAYEGKGKGPRIPLDAIGRVFAPRTSDLRRKHGPQAGIKPEQEAAVRHALSGDQFVITQGYAGTGKSFITSIQREIVESKGYMVYGCAPSCKATNVLKTDSGLNSDRCVVPAKLLFHYG